MLIASPRDAAVLLLWLMRVMRYAAYKPKNQMPMRAAPEAFVVHKTQQNKRDA